jgi:hypothetical protein
VADCRKAGPGCCRDCGNAGPNDCARGAGSGTMSALFLDTAFFGKGAGNGPWFMGDFEFGVWSGGSQSDSNANPKLPAENPTERALGILRTNTMGSTPQDQMRTANAQTGGVTTAWDGQAPKPCAWAAPSSAAAAATTATGPRAPSAEAPSPPAAPPAQPMLSSWPPSRQRNRVSRPASGR